MTQLPRIGDTIISPSLGLPWKIIGTVDDRSDLSPGTSLTSVAQDSRELVALLIEGPHGTATISADEFWQHWTPATQRNT